MSVKTIITEELKELLNSKDNVSETTKKNYINQYNKLYSQLGKPIGDADEDKIIDSIKEISNDNPSNSWTYLNIPIMVKKLLKKDVDKLEEWRNELKEQRESHTKKNNDNKELPSLKTLQEFTNQLYEQGKWRDFIINELLLTLGLRNKDLNLTIVDKEPDDVSRNYLVAHKAAIELIINDYKTAANYGKKELVIRNKKLRHAVSQLPLNSNLLENSNVIHRYIQRRLYKHNGKYLGEADYFKILVKATMKKKNSMKLLEMLSDTRGTDVQTIFDYYNIQNSKSS
jgi:hypothetical protein